MKKYITILALIIIIIPSIAFASWWNPLSWFNNWSFSKGENKTEILEKRILELEQKLDVEDITPINETDSIIEEQEVITEVKVETLKKEPAEPNVATIIADYYQNIALGSTKSALEIFSAYSSDLDRYIQGIPSVTNNFKQMILIGFEDNDADILVSHVDDWGEDYLSDFRDLKNIVNTISKEIETQQSILIRTSGELRTKYVPASQSSVYTQEIDKYSNQTKLWMDDIKRAHDSLVSKFIEDKDNTNELIYQAGVNNISIETPPLPVYSPPTLNISTYKPPIRTYCNSFANNSFSCTSSSW